MDARFILSPGGRREMTVLDGVSLVRIPLDDHDAVVKKRALVNRGTLIATHSSPNVGDMHAPFAGTVKEVTPAFIEIEALPPEAAQTPGGEAAAPARTSAESKEAQAEVPEEGQAAPARAAKASAEGKEAPAKAAKTPAVPPPSPAPVSFDGLDAVQLGKALKELGIPVRLFNRPARLFIINGLNPEPGMLYAEELLGWHRATLEAGLALARRLSDAPRFVLALPEGSPHSLPGADAHYVKPVYPVSLSYPLIRAVTGKERPEDITVLRLHALFALGLVAESGLPLTRAVTTALGQNYLAPVGTPVSAFFDRQGLRPEPGDTVLLGGAMRGAAIAGTSRGIGKGDDAVQFIKKGALPPLEDTPCIGCGACVHICPVRLRPNMLSRYAEFGLYESCRKEHIEVCIECGLCGYICPSCRPMQQYFRMAKHHLGLISLQHRLGK